MAGRVSGKDFCDPGSRIHRYSVRAGAQVSAAENRQQGVGRHGIADQNVVEASFSRFERCTCVVGDQADHFSWHVAAGSGVGGQVGRAVERVKLRVDQAGCVADVVQPSCRDDGVSVLRREDLSEVRGGRRHSDGVRPSARQRVGEKAFGNSPRSVSIRSHHDVDRRPRSAGSQ